MANAGGAAVARIVTAMSFAEERGVRVEENDSGEKPRSCRSWLERHAPRQPESEEISVVGTAQDESGQREVGTRH